MTQAPPQPADRSAASACPRCGAGVAPDQLLCLECGERLRISYRRPPSWRLPAAIVAGIALLAGAGLAIALVEIGDEAERVARAPAPTQAAGATAPGAPPATTPAPGAGTTPAPGSGTAPAPGGEATTEPDPPTPDDSATGAAGGVGSWPDGTSAYTVILLSTGTRAGAQTEAREAIGQGIEAGVLRSDDYDSLRPGFWVAYGGTFDSQEEAQTEAQRYASLGFPGAYVRFVDGGD